ncbi:MAG: hypothetical protein WBS16_07285 [Thermoplasmata archaeon]
MTPRPGEFQRPRLRGVRLLALALMVGALGLILVVPGPASDSTPRTLPASLGASAAPEAATPAANAPTLDLSASTTPSSICVLELTSCPAGVGVARATLTAQAPEGGFETWPTVQIAFVIETTVYDGVFDPTVGDPGADQCALLDDPAGGACEESNGVPFFVSNAQQIANAIQAANPHTTVSFALVDYFATLDVQDDGDGEEYHVDIPQFVPASEFGQDTASSLGSTVLESGYRYSDSDFSDSFLHSSSITALYGAIVGSGLDWSEDTHHVVVWMGSTAPRAPGYVQDYCVSPSSHYPPAAFATSGIPCYSASCEPSYTFGTYSSPQCEGWTTSQNGNASDSIAALARTSPTCTDSIGGVCTVDMIDLWDTATDPSSPGWPAADATPTLGGGPNGPLVQQNTVRVLLAGCDLAAATGGTWDGPSFFSCPNGQSGTLQPEFLGPFGSPNLQNPSLFSAFRQVGFGPVTSTLVASGTDQPLFAFVPYGNIEVLPGSQAQFRTACELTDGSLYRDCPVQPELRNVPLGPGRNVTVYSWNWSTIPSQNLMFAGDTWTASFWIMADGPPYSTVPVDACTTTYCSVGGSRALGGYFTEATYLPVTNISVLVQSFPLATIGVEAPPSVAPPPTAPPPAVTPAPPPAPIIAPTPIPAPLGVAAQVGVASVSLQAAAAGFLAAGFTTVSIRNKPMSIAVAALAQKSGPVKSRFEESTTKDASSVGRFE